MSLLGTALGRMAHGASQVANKYIDEEMLLNRQQALEELKHASAVRLDQYQNSPERRGRLRAEEALDLEAKNAAALRSKTAEATDETLQSALRKNTAEDAKSKATAEAEIQKQFGNDPLYVQARRRIAQATHVDSAASVAQAELARMEIADRKRLGQLYDELATVEADAATDPDAKRDKARSLMSQITAIKSKNAPAGQRDPELDTEKVVEETTMPDGTVRKVERKQVRRPGGAKQDGPGNDPLNLRADKTPAQPSPAQASAGPALESKSSVAGRPYMSWDAKSIERKLAEKRLPFMERADLMRELEVRKQGDITPM